MKTKVLSALAALLFAIALMPGVAAAQSAVYYCTNGCTASVPTPGTQDLAVLNDVHNDLGKSTAYVCNPALAKQDALASSPDTGCASYTFNASTSSWNGQQAGITEWLCLYIYGRRDEDSAPCEMPIGPADGGNPHAPSDSTINAYIQGLINGGVAVYGCFDPESSFDCERITP